MNDMIEIITAQTHTAEYLLHKYWARKPHNVISHFIRTLVDTDGSLLDPFCGSGVTLREAQKLGIHSVGLDINPVAVLNSKVLTHAPDSDEFTSVIESILTKIEPAIHSSYSTTDGRTVKYLVHVTETVCPSCHIKIGSDKSLKDGKKNLCPMCKCELKFNLESFSGSHITAACIDNSKELITDSGLLSAQTANSSKPLFSVDTTPYDFTFIENRRILAYGGMQTHSLFTPRNFSILCYIASEFERIEDESIRETAMLFLTASVAQCSRLIPYRNNLTTGGPAWSVPGFWVPPQHLETNPVIHLRARLKKFAKGLTEINKHTAASYPRIENADCLRYLSDTSETYDLIFLDPPYGDNVPYTEFSTMWNSFLKLQPDFDKDFSVSDRMSRDKSWAKYTDKLNRLLSLSQHKLKPDGHVLITFNNNDIKAWEALLGALQSNHYVCDYVTYVIPAVISSKAQFSPKGSYISDIYSIYSYDPDSTPSCSLNCVTNALIQCTQARQGLVAKNLIYRTIMIEWIRHNICCTLLNEIPRIISSLFTDEKDMFKYKGSLDQDLRPLCESAKLAAKKILENGPCSWNDLYTSIATEYIRYGFIDSNELRSYLDPHIIFSQNRCIAYKE